MVWLKSLKSIDDFGHPGACQIKCTKLYCTRDMKQCYFRDPLIEEPCRSKSPGYFHVLISISGRAHVSLFGGQGSTFYFLVQTEKHNKGAVMYLTYFLLIKG